MQRTAIALIDGENLVLRYEAMVNGGREPYPDSIHKARTFIWHDKLLGDPIHADVLRVSYYASSVGDSCEHEAVTDALRRLHYTYCVENVLRVGFLVPHVFKKKQGSEKSKRVDIAVCVEALVHAADGNATDLYLASGDGDFVPLVAEVMRRGIRVHILAFSSGCSPDLRRAPDSFTFLDDRFFRHITT